MKPVCEHKRVQIIAKDDAGQFVECLDCKEIFESSELGEPGEPEPTEDLSDA